jgi:hypothetical protein
LAYSNFVVWKTPRTPDERNAKNGTEKWAVVVVRLVVLFGVVFRDKGMEKDIEMER